MNYKNISDTKINQMQIGGDFYKSEYQVWDFIVEAKIPYLWGNVIKYITRHEQKGKLKDLYKAYHYLKKANEVASEPHAEEYRKEPIKFNRRLFDYFITSNKIKKEETEVILSLLHDWYKRDVTIRKLKELIALRYPAEASKK